MTPTAFFAKIDEPDAIGTRTISYAYDGLLRLSGASESPGNTYVYSYDSAGNRTSVQVNGGTPTTYSYNAANEVTNTGWQYDQAGNLIGDGTATSTYDALSRTKTVTAGSQTRTNSYNGDSVLVTQVANATTTRYTQDLASPLSQVLQAQGSATTNHLYGAARLAFLSGSTGTWYATDERTLSICVMLKTSGHCSAQRPRARGPSRRFYALLGLIHAPYMIGRSLASSHAVGVT